MKNKIYWYFKRMTDGWQWLRLRRTIAIIKKEQDQKTRAEAIYSYIAILMTRETAGRPITLEEFERISAMILGNILITCESSHQANQAVYRVTRLARDLANIERKVHRDEEKFRQDKAEKSSIILQ